MFPDATGVKKENIRLFLTRRLPITGGDQLGRGQLAVEDVHLASDRYKIKFFHYREKWGRNFDRLISLNRRLNQHQDRSI